jgi:hypothetical protein
MVIRMSDDYSKLKHSKRRLKSETHAKKQSKIAKIYGIVVDSIHRYAKKHWADCGNSDCSLCGNPRKIWGEKTIQEKRSEQRDRTNG